MKKYAIIGGGAAGIAAAYQILSSDSEAQVHLFEAKSYYGVRAHTDAYSIKGLAFDMGPVYLQDPENNPWKTIAENLGFTLQEDVDGYEMRVDRGHGFETICTTSDPDVNAVNTDITKDYESNKAYPVVVK
ncbi:NAD(P)-binding protein [Colwellia sp. MB02u-14]|uniref:NAD(P)-binding protein n=1 Tax=Colwellia sp. MB02u-14 TaxID=2759815 RepID=UPI0015F4BFAC|nr:NAD(P)-binding protein [Colwellia sp. MB02u-14]MBA6304215.1 NAD(P)-binding protein [Colwellia sp. MB02u-14]